MSRQEHATTCAEVRRLIAEGGGASDDAARAHLAQCAACQQLAADDARLAHALDRSLADDDVAPPSFDELAQALEADSRGPRAWLRERPTWQRVLIGVGVIGGAVIAGGAKLRADLPDYPQARFGLELALLIAANLAAVWFWLRPLHLPTRPGLAKALAVTALLLPALIALLPPAHAAEVGHRSTQAVLKGALPCLIYGAALGLPVSLLVLALGRSLGAARGLLAVGSGGLAGVTALHLHCPSTLNLHMLAGHASIPLLFGGIFLLVIALFRRRRRPQ